MVVHHRLYTVEKNALVDKPDGTSRPEVEVTINNYPPHSVDKKNSQQKSKPWYQQWWARVAGAVALLAGIVTIIGYSFKDIMKLFNNQ